MWTLKKKRPVEPLPVEIVADADESFGIFAAILEGTIAYMKLLHLDGPEATETVSLVMKCCASVPNPYQDIRRLLRQDNWRSHLVAAVALATLATNTEANDELWNAIDKGSWVTPQLAAVALLRDPMFAERARKRLRSGCPVHASQAAKLSGPKRHSSTGPGGSVERSAKTAASLVALVGLLPETDWLVAEAASVDLMSLLDKDIDSSGMIAERWLKRLSGNSSIRA
jgi:hypothetical protein